MAPTPLPVSINGRGFLADFSSNDFTRRALQTTYDNSGADQPYAPTGVWRRGVESWHLGMGQSRLDREASVPYRYKDSQGVDVWNKWELSLLNDVKQATTWPTGVGNVSYGIQEAVNDKLMAYQNNVFRFYTHQIPDDTNYTEGSLPAGENIIETCNVPTLGTLGLTSKGKVYQLNTDGSSNLLGTVPTNPYGQPPNARNIGYVNARIVVASNGDLWDAQYSFGTLTFEYIWTHPAGDFPQHIAEGPRGTYMSYFFEGVVYHMELKDDGTGFDAPKIACRLATGEKPLVTQFYLGYVAIGTNLGVRFAIPDAGNYLSFGPLLPIPGGVRSMTTGDRFIWFGWGCWQDWYETPDGHRMQGLGRMDLSAFTAPLVPAYASDVMFKMPADLTNITVNGPTYVFTLGDANTYVPKPRHMMLFRGIGICYVDLTESVEEGWLEQGIIGFRTAEEKIALNANLRTNPLPADTSVEVEVSWDSGPYERVTFLDTDGAEGSGNVPLDGEPFEKSAWKYTLRRDPASADPLTTPVMTRLDFKAMPITGKASEWVVPIMVFDEIHYDGVTMLRDVDDDFEYLAGLVRSGGEFEYAEGNKTFHVHATGGVWRPEKESQSRNGFCGTFYLQFRELAL